MKPALMRPSVSLLDCFLNRLSSVMLLLISSGQNLIMAKTKLQAAFRAFFCLLQQGCLLTVRKSP